MLWFYGLKTKSRSCFPNLKLIDFLSLFTFFIAYLMRLECIIILSTSADSFLSYFFVLMFSLSALILSKIILFSSLIFSLNILCLLAKGALKEDKLWDFRLSISYIFLTRDLFSAMTGSIF